MNKVISLHQLECMEQAELNDRTERRRLEARVARAEERAFAAEAMLQEEKARHKKEMSSLLYGLSVLSCLVAALSCFVTAPWWTAVAPMIFAAVILRKAGW